MPDIDLDAIIESGRNAKYSLGVGGVEWNYEPAASHGRDPGA